MILGCENRTPDVTLLKLNMTANVRRTKLANIKAGKNQGIYGRL